MSRERTKPPSSNLMPFLSGPLAAGGIVASSTLLLPPWLMSEVAGRLPAWLVRSRTLVPAKVRVPLAVIPGRAYLVVAGFVAGYLGRKYVIWLRLWLIRHLLKYQEWLQKATWKTKIWAALLKVVEGRPPFQTFEFQKCLPKLPVPDLDRTLDRWLEVSQVFVSESQFQLTKEAVEELRNNEGPKLQSFLLERYEKTENWLSDYWLFAAYLSYREPLICNSNYYTTSVLPDNLITDQLARAATVIAKMAQFERLLARMEYDPIMMQDLVPVCMNGYNYIFNMIRVPGEHVDTPSKYPNQRHVVVIRNGLYFRLDVDASNKRGHVEPLTPEELKLQLKRICDEADSLTQDLPVAALTAQNRTVWAKQRLALAEKNKETLEVVEKSMFVAVLDDRAPKDADDMIKIMMTGKGNDRWFDKGFNLVTFTNAHCGSNIEHSVLDAMIFVSMNEYLMLHEHYENGDVVRDPERPPRSLPTPKRLVWNLDGMETAIAGAVKTIQDVSNDIDLHVLICKYGKGFMKKCRLSPDGYIQMALLLGYSRLHKETPKTYEPASCRLYAMGRTETIHPGSSWSNDWVRSMDDPEASAEQKKTLLKQAIRHQNQFRIDATVGQGCDRHLLGLLCASRELGMDLPKIFRDEAWTKSFKLSTSQTPNRVYEGMGPDTVDYPLCNGGFGPSCHDGYGISYIIYGDAMINISIASWHSCKETDSIKLANEIDRAMDDMKMLHSSSSS